MNNNNGDSSTGDGKPAPTKEPRYTKLTQQELPASKPVLDAAWSTFIFAAIAFVMIPVGAVCLAFGMKPVEVVYRYDNYCATQQLGPNYKNRDAQQWLLNNQQPDSINIPALRCTFNVTITKPMPHPIFIYYELDGVYQNHRRYVKSRSDVQLAGKNASSTDLASCQPQLYYQDNQSLLINPCGLVAWSNFNDTYQLTRTSTAGGGPTVRCS